MNLLDALGIFIMVDIAVTNIVIGIFIYKAGKQLKDEYADFT